MQLHIYSIDTRTEIAHSSSFYVRMWTHDPKVESFEVVILRPDYQEALRIISWNESGHQQIYEEIKTDPSEVSVPWQWRMHPKRPYSLGTPFDYYEVSFLIAINMSISLNLNDTWVNMALPLRGIWTWDEHPEVIKLSSAPDNKSLTSHGLSPMKFYQYNCDTMTDFYLISEFFRFPFMDSCRVALAYFSPSIAIFLVLLVSGIKFKKMSTSDFLRLYLGAGLFILTFLVSFYQFAPSKVWTWQEAIFHPDFLIVTVLVIVALLMKQSKPGSNDESGNRNSDSEGKAEDSNKDQKLQIERLISEITSRESSTLVFSTVTASASLAFLVFVVQSPMTEWFDLAFWTGFLFSIIGFVY